ncbi:hypothetical protein KI387_035372 [Taxus chinensis]|uniref:Cellulose synthase n=1 Tax=Taxus chinensis TaxID=29808 RepID=A0AA38KN50_TAXCH|nr:hypothetical protein KI387_035372 [Taxus chinensis]
MVGIVGVTEIKGVTYVIGATDINDVGSSWETIGGKVEEGKAKLVVVDAEVGVRVGGMDRGMPYTSYPDESYSGESASKLPPVDIIITTTDPFREPAILTANTVLSVLALDYPVEKIACYVSDDGRSPITFYSLLETLEFAKKWVPFCRKFNIESRAPFMYFSKKPPSSDPSFLQEWECMKCEYERLKRRIAEALETEHVPLDSVSENGVNCFESESSEIRIHSSIVKVIHENKVVDGSEDDDLPHLIYVAREKIPKVNHHYKAGAMNVMARVSGLMTNAPFILNLDCDMHICNPKVIQHAMCFYLDCPSERECGFIQFPQLFYGVLDDDPLGNQHKTFFTTLAKGMNGIQGPVYGGTCCFHRRKGLYGVPPSPPADKYRSKEKILGFNGKELQDEFIRSAFGESSALVASAHAIMRDNGWHKPSSPSLVIEESLMVSNCSYEANTAWGKEVGWMYGSTVEDVMTGLKVHSLGWHSIYYTPEQPAFMGCAPGNGPDILVQNKRWAAGLLEILMSKLCPLLGKQRQLMLRQRMLYAYFTVSPITSVAVLCYAILPAFSLLTGKSFLPKIQDPAFITAAGLFISVHGYGHYEHLTSGCSAREWWNSLRTWLITILSASLFAIFDVVMKLMGLSETVFVVTPKGGDEEEASVGDFTFDSSPLFIPPTTVILINLAAIIQRTSQIVGGHSELKDNLFGEYFCSVWVLINLRPFLKGLVRKGKLGLPWSIVIKSGALALFVCRTWAY